MVPLTKDCMYHKMIKHIDIQYYFIQIVILKDKVIVKNIGTELNLTDMFIKLLPIAKFKFSLKSVSVCF